MCKCVEGVGVGQQGGRRGEAKVYDAVEAAKHRSSPPRTAACNDLIGIPISSKSIVGDEAEMGLQESLKYQSLK